VLIATDAAVCPRLGMPNFGEAERDREHDEKPSRMVEPG